MSELHGYTVESLIRRTPLTQLHTAVRNRDQKRVVLKRYAADVATLRTPLAEREYSLLQQMNAPEIIRAITVEHDQNQAVLVLEWFPGKSLSDYTESRRVTNEDFCTVAAGVTSALEYVHASRVIHRDIKPSNILVDPESLQIRLIDFGIAMRYGSATSPDELRSETEKGDGTLHFMSPEQSGRMDRGIDFRSDLYSLGATFYYMLTGQPPFPSEDPLELVHSLLARMPPAPRELCPEVPETLSQIVMKLLTKEPNDRYQPSEGKRSTRPLEAATHLRRAKCEGPFSARRRFDRPLMPD